MLNVNWIQIISVLISCDSLCDDLFVVVVVWNEVTHWSIEWTFLYTLDGICGWSGFS